MTQTTSNTRMSFNKIEQEHTKNYIYFYALYVNILNETDDNDISRDDVIYNLVKTILLIIKNAVIHNIDITKIFYMKLSYTLDEILDWIYYQPKYQDLYNKIHVLKDSLSC
jgi:hypothetical protein